MTSTVGATPKKRSRRVYESVKVMNCTRCGRLTNHTLYGYEKGIYKCNTCGTIHTK